MNQSLKKKILISSFLLVFFDQVIKFLVEKNLSKSSSITIINNFFNITYVENKGAAFGIFSNSTLILIIISIIFLYFFIKYLLEEKTYYCFKIIYLVMILSGVIGNLIDRIFRNFVIDYLDFTIFSYDFPVFNLADILIVVGAFFLILDLFIRGDEDDLRRRKH